MADASTTQPEPQTTQPEPHGISGWLILPMLGTIISPALSAFGLFQNIEALIKYRDQQTAAWSYMVIGEIVFTLGIAPSKPAALGLARRYQTTEAVERAWDAMERHWESYLSPLQVETPDPGFDVMANVWLKYQAMSGRIWGRSGYYQPGGAFGYRDQLQDSQVFLPIDPARTRRQILLHAAHQYADGTTLHWWHPLTEEGLRKPLNDDLLWLAFVTLNYLRETADFSILDERAPFLAENGSAPPPDGTLYDHCRRAIDSFWDRMSPRGVPRSDVNPRPLSDLVPSNGLIGCYSADERLVLAIAFEPYQELFQGVRACIHADFRIGGLKAGESKRVRGKIYIVPADIDALLKRYAKDFPERVRKD